MEKYLHFNLLKYFVHFPGIPFSTSLIDRRRKRNLSFPSFHQSIAQIHKLINSFAFSHLYISLIRKCLIFSLTDWMTEWLHDWVTQTQRLCSLFLFNLFWKRIGILWILNLTFFFSVYIYVDGGGWVVWANAIDWHLNACTSFKTLLHSWLWRSCCSSAIVT